MHREIGNGAWDSWFMPLQDQVHFNFKLKFVHSCYLNCLPPRVCLILLFYTDRCCLWEGTGFILLKTTFIIQILFFPWSLRSLIEQVKEMKELSDGYNIVGLSQVINLRNLIIVHVCFLSIHVLVFSRVFKFSMVVYLYCCNSFLKISVPI